MAASRAYKANSATFDGTLVDGITDISVSINGSPVDLLTDGETSIEAVFIDAKAADISVTTTDISGAVSFSVGDCGVLSVVFSQRACGSGSVGGGNQTATASNAVVTSISPASGVTGIAATSITWRCSGPDSTEPVAW